MLEESRNNPPAVVEGLQPSPACLKIFHQPGPGQLRDRRFREVLFQPLQVTFQARQVRFGQQVLLVFMLLRGDVIREPASVRSFWVVGSR